MGIRFDAIVLSSPEVPDASTGTNAAELRRLLPPGANVCALPRTSPEDADARLKVLVAGLG